MSSKINKPGTSKMDVSVTSTEDESPPKKKARKKTKSKQKNIQEALPLSSETSKPLKKRLPKEDDSNVLQTTAEEATEELESTENFCEGFPAQLKLEDYSHNDIHEITIDEVSLEGLDGITIEALWTRLSVRTAYPMQFQNEMQDTVWKILTATEKIKYYLLPEDRPKLIIYNRFKYIDFDTGQITEPDEVPEDIYPFVPVSEEDGQNQYFGSCANFKTRLNITEEVRQLTLAQVTQKYGSKLVIVADQVLRNKALGLQNAKSLDKLSNIHYCMLERIGRARYLGEVTAGKNSLQQMSDSKNLFYLRKILLVNGLITKQSFCTKFAKGNTSALLFHLTRFHREHKPTKTILTEQIIDILKRKRDYRIEYIELKKLVGFEVWGRGVQKLIKTPEFKQYVQTDLLVPYRTMYPNASQKEWKVKNGTKEKNLRILQLINPAVHLTSSSKEEDPKDESSDDEPIGEYAYNVPVFHQIYKMIQKSGAEGLSLRQVQRNLGLDFYVTRSILNNMVKRSLVETKNVDAGRVHVLKYYISSTEEDSTLSKTSPNETPSTSRDQTDDDTLSFIADVLEISKDDLVPKDDTASETDSETEPENSFKGHYDFIRDYRTKNRLERYTRRYKTRFQGTAEEKSPNEKKLQSEEREKFEAIFKNDHPYYPMDLSLRHKRIESWPLSINVDKDFAEMLQEISRNSQRNIKPPDDDDYSFEKLNSEDLDKIKTLSKPLKQNVLRGSTEKATQILKNYLFLPTNLQLEILLKRYQTIMSNIRHQYLKKEFQYPDDSSSDGENYFDRENRDNTSLEVNVEEAEFQESSTKKVPEEDEEIKDFKTILVNNFDNSNYIFAGEDRTIPLLAAADVKINPKRKAGELQENSSKRIKVESGVPVLEENNEEEPPEHITEVPETLLKKITDMVKMEVYMGKDPIVLSHCLDEDNIQTTIISTKDVEQVPSSEKYVNKTMSQRSVSRANFILETVYREKIISDIPKLVNALKSIESEKKLIGIVDRKSVDRLLFTLTKAGYIKIFKIILKYENVLRCKNIVCLASLDATSTLQVFIDQLKIVFFIYARKKSDATKATVVTSEVTPSEGGPFDNSYNEIIALTSNQTRPQYKYSRVIARQYGYVPKFAKIKIMHELLFYLIYGYDGEAVNRQNVPAILKQFHVKANRNSIETLGTLYKRELSWKMFIPPLPKYKDWPGGWALICDIILRLPLSIFVKIFNIAYIIPELIPLLNDPLKKHILLKNVPTEIRNACLHNRKCIFSIHEILCHLCYMGLLQFGVHKLKEKEQQFIYLNRRAVLYDTTSSEPGYHQISAKEYPVLQFYFENQAMIDNYWSKIWTISMATKLGQRHTLLDKTITLQDIHTKPQMMQSVMPKSPGNVLESDIGYIPGDHLGACCFDSSAWVHVKRNWIWSNSAKKIGRSDLPPKAPLLGMRRKHLEQVKFKSIKYKDLPRELSKKKFKKGLAQSEIRTETKSVTKNSRKHPVIRKVLPRPPSKKIKILQVDELDKKIMIKMGRSRAVWSDEEDAHILICNFVKKFLIGSTNRKVIPGTVFRDTMHRLSSNKRKRTTTAYSRRCIKLVKGAKGHGTDRYSCHLENDRYLQKIFSRFRTRIASGEAIPDHHINIAFVYLVSYVCHTFKNKFINQEKVPSGQVYSDYLTDKDIPNYFTEDARNPEIIYQHPQTIDAIKVEVIKDIIHCSLSWKSETSEFPLMLYRAYQHYPDNLVGEAISWMRKQQIVAGKKIGAKHWNVKEGIHMAGKLIHNSFVYSFKQITKYPDYIYPEAYQMLISIYKYHNVERDFLFYKYEQGHGLGLSEIACLHNVIFTFKIPDDMLVLDPKISDHSQLIQELAVRYKFLLQQKVVPRKDDDQEQKSADSDNIENVEKAIEVIFEAQKRKCSKGTTNKLIDNDGDEIELTGRENPTTSKITTKNAEESIEKDPKLKTTENETAEDRSEDTLKALQHLTTYLGNKQENDSIRISDLAYLLTKGLFPELDDDEERLEKLNRHFLIMYPSSTFRIPDTLIGKDWVEEILKNGRVKGDEIQEMIKSECIIKNTLHDEEVANSLIDIGGDDEDIKLAFKIVNYVKHMGPYGVSTAELKKQFLFKTHNLELYEITNLLIKIGMFFRTGVRDIRLVHVSENETWTIGLDDERPISEINLNSLGIRLKLMPWVRINGTLNLKVLQNWMYVILAHCLSCPFATLTNLMKRFNIMKPVDIFSLLEYLQTLDCLRIYTYVDSKRTTLLSEFAVLEERPANILDDFETIFVETDKIAIIKMGALRYKGQTDIDIPFEE